MTSQLIGPLYTNVTYLGAGPFTNFFFICRVSFQQSYVDSAGFDVVLTFNSQRSNVTRNIKSFSSSSSQDVIFTSEDVIAGFGSEVSFCVMTSYCELFLICYLTAVFLGLFCTLVCRVLLCNVCATFMMNRYDLFMCIHI